MTGESSHYVQDFAAGSREQADLLGGKGANLAEMVRLGLPVPPGFTVTTEACRAYLATGDAPAGLWQEVDDHLERLERERGQRLGAAEDPLLLSVRSGSRFSMPGMMDTVLDLGLNDESVQGLIKATGQERAAWDSYRRLVQMYGETVLGIPRARFDTLLDALRDHRCARNDLELDDEDLRELTYEYRELVQEQTGADFPQDPREQLRGAVLAVFRSWQGERARVYRRREGIPDTLGTAVNVQAMVFGNLGPDSGTGVAFTRDPATGRSGVYGDYLTQAQGEDVVAGIRNAVPLERLAEVAPTCHRELLDHLHTLELHWRDLCDVEFTVERGRLWVLQTRVGKRTPEAAFRIAVQLADEGLINLDEALRRVTGEQLTHLLFPRFALGGAARLLATGTPASPGAAVGEAVFTSADAVRRAAEGAQVVLVRPETTPDDLPGMLAAQAVLTSRGGKTSHAAVVARGLGKVCVCGASALRVDAEHGVLRTDRGVTVRQGDVLSVDGTEGAVHLGARPLVESPVAQALRGEAEPRAEAAELVRAVRLLLDHADRRRRLGVRANADTAADVRTAMALGAEGVGLVRTEHMFLGERRMLVQDVVLARDETERRAALERLLPLQRSDFAALLEAAGGRPLTVRLLDPPLHEFLPDLTELSEDVAVARATGQPVTDRAERLLEALRRTHEQNPMLGLRGVRLGLSVPGLVAVQVRALAEAVAARVREGRPTAAELMVPLVMDVAELEATRAEVEPVLAEVAAATGTELRIPFGTMVELPRAALTAGRLAREAEFFSFGTNDLTQTVWGLSRDDAEAGFLPGYLDRGLMRRSPFETLDHEGVGRLVRLAVEEGRAARPGLETGVCGEHGGDPDSVRFFHDVGLDYVSCSPLRVPVARLEAGRAAVA